MNRHRGHPVRSQVSRCSEEPFLLGWDVSGRSTISTLGSLHRRGQVSTVLDYVQFRRPYHPTYFASQCRAFVCAHGREPLWSQVSDSTPSINEVDKLPKTHSCQIDNSLSRVESALRRVRMSNAIAQICTSVCPPLSLPLPPHRLPAGRLAATAPVECCFGRLQQRAELDG